MKTCNYMAVVLLLLLVAAQSACKRDFLEIQIKGYLIAESTKDYDQLLNALYLDLYSPACSFLGDEVAAQQAYFDGTDIRERRLFRFEDIIYQRQELPSEVKGYSYIQRQYIFNKIIAEVMDSKHGTDIEKRTILAEAKVGRALCHLMFMNDFAMPYNPATASKDLGVPLLTTSETTNRKFARSSVRQVYQFMIKDLTEALPDLDNLTHRGKFSKLTAEFYLTRIYLYMGDLSSARKHVDAAFFNIDKSNIPVSLYDYNKVLAIGGEWEVDKDVGYGPANIPLPINNTEIIYSIVGSPFAETSANTFVMRPKVVGLFGRTDQRLKFYSNQELFGQNKFPHGMMRFLGKTFDMGASLADLYLMRAEIRARHNDLRGAVEDIEHLRKNRMANNIEIPQEVATNQQSLVRFIMDERIREFALKGMRWLDMRRLSVDPIYNNNVIYKHEIYNRQGNVAESFVLSPKRFVLKFGERMVAENPGLVDNP